MPKYTVQAGSVTIAKDPKDLKGDRLVLKVGDELELTKQQAEKMDREGHYLCLSSEYGKAKRPAPAAKPPPPPDDEDEELDDEELEALTKPLAK